ncbi:hypothetical protein RYX36_033195 [Vicia faba]
MATIAQAVEQDHAPPHHAMFLVIPYLRVYEVLTMSRVCTSLRDAVNNDVLPWLCIIIETRLNFRLTDETLLKITSKANGRLQKLALMNCIHITDQGLQRVIEQNPFIKELHIPACTSITPEGVLKAVETLCQRNKCLTTLSINGIYNLQKEHLDILTSNLKENLSLENMQMQQPIYYHKRGSVSAFECQENHRIIDLEICPKCSEVKMVYDCPKMDCKMKECKGCIFCIPRCENCGECVGSEEPEECACGDIMCLECWLKVPKCSFCNKPYCKQHTDWWCTSSDSSLMCRVCDENSHGYTYTDEL